jgi:hypothetical protein
LVGLIGRNRPHGSGGNAIADYDYIMVSSGFGGCVSANRLSEGPIAHVPLWRRAGPSNGVPCALRMAADVAGKLDVGFEDIRPKPSFG